MKNNQNRGQKRRKHVENRARRKPARDRAKKETKRQAWKQRQLARDVAAPIMSLLHRPWRDIFGSRRNDL